MYKRKEKHLKLRLGARGLGVLLPPMTHIFGAPLAPIGPSGHHVLGGLLLQARDILFLSPLRPVLLLFPHQINDPLCQGFIVLDFYVKFFSNS
jgi:hypothetical protein